MAIATDAAENTLFEDYTETGEMEKDRLAGSAAQIAHRAKKSPAA